MKTGVTSGCTGIELKLWLVYEGLMAQLPPLPRIDNPELYTIHDELMPLQIRRTYIKDQMRNAHTYIMEYSAILEMIKEDMWRMSFGTG